MAQNKSSPGADAGANASGVGTRLAPILLHLTSRRQVLSSRWCCWCHQKVVGPAADATVAADAVVAAGSADHTRGRQTRYPMPHRPQSPEPAFRCPPNCYPPHPCRRPPKSRHNRRCRRCRRWHRPWRPRRCCTPHPGCWHRCRCKRHANCCRQTRQPPNCRCC